jgi:hypothetical protein
MSASTVGSRDRLIYKWAIMRLISTVLLTLSLVTACSNKKADKGDKPDKGDKAATPDQPAGPSKVDVKVLWADFNGGLKGMDLMNKYRDAVTFTAPVKSVGEEMDHSPIVMLDVDGKNLISIKFTDPKVISGKAPKAGDSLTVTCKIGGANGSLMMATDCTM